MHFFNNWLKCDYCKYTALWQGAAEIARSVGGPGEEQMEESSLTKKSSAVQFINTLTSVGLPQTAINRCPISSQGVLALLSREAEARQQETTDLT